MQDTFGQYKNYGSIISYDSLVDIGSSRGFRYFTNTGMKELLLALVIIYGIIMYGHVYNKKCIY